jgi:hypothetical protein
VRSTTPVALVAASPRRAYATRLVDALAAARLGLYPKSVQDSILWLDRPTFFGAEPAARGIADDC